MTPPVIAAIIISLVLGLTTIIYFFREEKTQQELREKEQLQKNRLAEISILKEIQDRISYTLDLEKIVEIIIGSLSNVVPYTTASYLLLGPGEKLTFKVQVNENIGKTFVDEVKDHMVSQLSTMLNRPFSKDIDEDISGVLLQEENQTPVAAAINIPVIINNNLVGLITVASNKPGIYTEEEKTILSQIVNQATTALSQLHQVLDLEKGKLVSMIRSLADGVFMIDTNNQILVINNAAKEILHIRRDDPTIIDILAFFEKKYDLAGKIAESIRENKTITEQEVKLGDKMVQIFITPVFDKRINKVIGVSVLLHDITLEKNILQMKEDFTNMMVHELRAPLTAIKGASGLLMDQDKLTPKEQQKLLATIHEQSNMLLDQVGSILDAAKMESGKFVLTKSVEDINKLISNKVTVFTPQARSKKITLSVKLDPNIKPFLFDPLRIGQVLNNLITNSIKFTKEDGKIVVSSTKTDNFVTISVTDTGVGIPTQMQQKLFSKFTQVESSDEKIEGTGLGLYIVKGIVEAHKGTVSLKSTQGVGTQISFSLPITS